MQENFVGTPMTVVPKTILLQDYMLLVLQM